MTHDHNHNHHSSNGDTKNIKIAFFLNFGFTILEIAGGIWTNSISIISDALHDLGFRVTYHTCGGNLGIEEHIVANGCDASETLAPKSIGGNQEPWDFAHKIDGRVALIGGVDQFNVVTDGSPEVIRDMVHRLFESAGATGDSAGVEAP